MTSTTRFAKLTSNRRGVEVYPIYPGQLGRHEKQAGFGEEPNDEALALWGFVRVEDVAPPAVTEDEILTEDQPAFVDGAWKRQWSVTARTKTDFTRIKSELGEKIFRLATRRCMPTDVQAKLAQLETDLEAATTGAAIRAVLQDAEDNL